MAGLLDHYLGEDAGDVRLNGKALPGILQSLTIRGGLQVDSARMISGAARSQPLGFQVPEVRLVLALPSGGVSTLDAILARFSVDLLDPVTCYGKAKLLDRFHRAVDSDGNPVKYRLTNVHAQARGIREVWFSGLVTGEAHNDVVTANVTLQQVESVSFEAARREIAAGGLTADTGAITVPDLDQP